jgi:hypothetical protein
LIVILPGQYIYIDNFCKNIASAIGALERIISYIPMSTAVQVYHALIQPHFDYCCSVWDGLGETLSTKLQKLQYRAVRVIIRTSYDTYADVLLDILLAWFLKLLKVILLLIYRVYSQLVVQNTISGILK